MNRQAEREMLEGERDELRRIEAEANVKIEEAGRLLNDAHDNFDTYHRHLGAFIAHKKPLLAIHYRLKELDKMLKP